MVFLLPNLNARLGQKIPLATRTPFQKLDKREEFLVMDVASCPSIPLWMVQQKLMQDPYLE